MAVFPVAGIDLPGVVTRHRNCDRHNSTLSDTARRSRSFENGDPDQSRADGRPAHDANAIAGHADHVLRGRAGRAEHVRPVGPVAGPGRP